MLRPSINHSSLEDVSRRCVVGMKIMINFIATCVNLSSRSDKFHYFLIGWPVAL